MHQPGKIALKNLLSTSGVLQRLFVHEDAVLPPDAQQQQGMRGHDPPRKIHGKYGSQT